MIQLQNVSYSYSLNKESVFALESINLTLKEGEFVAVIGANGSGKSTLAKLCNALLLPRQGTVKIDGLFTSDAANIGQIRHKVGMVFQNPDNQLVATIVEDEIAFGPENLGLPPHLIRQRIDQALEVVGMKEFLKHEPHLLSMGQKQRIAIAAILAMRPKYFVLDEPTSMLDFQGRQEVLAVVRQLREEKMGILYVTHFIEETITADRIILLKEGEILAQGRPEEILTRVELLEESSLHPPKSVLLGRSLAQAGVGGVKDLLTWDEIVEVVCSLN